jgi:hypothetical protein
MLASWSLIEEIVYETVRCGSSFGIQRV